MRAVFSVSESEYGALLERAADCGMSVVDYIACCLSFCDEVPVWLMVAVLNGDVPCGVGADDG